VHPLNYIPLALPWMIGGHCSNGDPIQFFLFPRIQFMNVGEMLVCGLNIPFILISCRDEEGGVGRKLSEGRDVVVIYVAVRDEDSIDILLEELINGHASLPPSSKEEKIMRVLT